jgi:uncharacterized protein with FMN-binding domain
MHRGLVALSTSAIAAVYVAGFLRTQSADATIGAASATGGATSPAAPIALAAAAPAPPRPTVAPQPTATSVPLARVVNPPAPPQTAPLVQPTSVPRPAPTVASSAPAALTGTFKDGTYDGQGSSRRGNVWVSIEIQAGRIANVTITRSTLQYPVRDIAGLPAQVVQRQTAQVDIVSRATFSSQAFRGAVSQALSKAG